MKPSVSVLSLLLLKLKTVCVYDVSKAARLFQVFTMIYCCTASLARPSDEKRIQLKQIYLRKGWIVAHSIHNHTIIKATEFHIHLTITRAIETNLGVNLMDHVLSLNKMGHSLQRAQQLANIVAPLIQLLCRLGRLLKHNNPVRSIDSGIDALRGD